MKNIFKFKSPSESNGFLLWKVNNLWQREITRILKKYNLTHTQFVIMASILWLSDEKKELTQIELANNIEIDVMMTSNVLRNLHKRDLIERHEHSTDTRAKTINLTSKGYNILLEAVNEVELFDIKFFKRVKKINVFNQQLQILLNQKE
ncbi:MAG: MarR family winged helix-turn-helix transcriptional regulator [Ignavibacteriaceae bacterium]